MKRVLLGFLLNLVIIISVHSATINVPGDQPTIQAGVDASVSGDTVLVAPGTYIGDGNREIIVSLKDIDIIGVGGAASVIVDADSSGNGFIISDGIVNVKGLSVINSGTAFSADISFITGKRTLNIDSCIIAQNGTGIRVDLSYILSVSLTNSKVLNNGTGFYSGLEDKDFNVSNCLFEGNNMAMFGAFHAINDTIRNGVDGFSGHRTEYGIEHLVEDCVIENMSGVVIGGGSLCTFRRCLIQNNPGSIITHWPDNNKWLEDCVITNNTGNGIRLVNDSEFPSTISLTRCVYANNTDGISGNGHSFAPFSLNIDRCTIVGNLDYAVQTGSQQCAKITNSIVAFNSYGLNIGNDDQINCSDVFSNYGGNYIGYPDQTGINGNISLDPLFCDTASNNYSLRSNSPCLPENNACNTLIGALGIGCIQATIDTIVLLNEENLHVLNHTPLISWSFVDPIIQTEFEIAIGTDNDWAFAEMWNPAPITSPDTFITYNGSPLLDGEIYYGRLKVSNSVAWSEWFEFSFRMNSKPTTPIPLAPIDDSVTNSTPTLWISNAVDAEGDQLFYDFSGNKYTGSGLVYEPLLVGNDIPEGIDSTGLVVTSPLEENALFFWEVRAFDGYEYSSWTTLLTSSFWVNDVNNVPSAPVAINPEETTSPLYNMQPTFNWTESFDVDPFDTVHYKLHLAIDSDFAFETLIDLIPENSYTLTFPLEYKEHYWWKVDAIDKSNNITTSNVLHFWTSCCIGIRGNVDSDALDQIDISDLVFLVAFMFQGGDEPLCMDEANIDGLGVIDISDLVGLATYMFSGGVEPAVCP